MSYKIFNSNSKSFAGSNDIQAKEPNANQQKFNAVLTLRKGCKDYGCCGIIPDCFLPRL